MKEAMDILKVLAEKLGTTSEYVWGVLVRQGEIEVYKTFGWAIFWLVLACIAGLGLRLAWARRDDGDSEMTAAVAVTSMVVGIVAVVFFACALGTYETPEAYALSSVLGALK